MPKQKIEKDLDKKSETPLADQGVTLQREESQVFYLCACPECGESDLELWGPSFYPSSEFLGVTGDGEFGCGDGELDVDYHWVIECRACGHRALDEDDVDTDTLLEWAAAHGQPMKLLEFTCPVCGDHQLDQVETDLKRTREVRAVYEIPENSKIESGAEIALSFEPVVRGARTVRYCCLQGHELSKTDGTFVETQEELVEWLKARQPSVNG